MLAKEDFAEFLHTLWDQMANFDAASSEAALNHLMTALAGHLQADNVICVCAVRMLVDPPGDPLRGWRVPMVRHLHPPSAAHMAMVRAEQKKLETGEADITAIRLNEKNGVWRAYRLEDLAGPEWYESDYYRRIYLGFGIHDTLWAGCPVSESAEIYFGMERKRPGRHTVEERDRLLAALRGLKWFLRQYMLAHGLCIASTPLTPAERSVLQGLLAGNAEKQVAAANAQSSHTTHDHVKSIYRKFGVKNRAGLMALWLGQPH